MINKLEWLDRSLLASPYYCLVLNEKQFHKALKHLRLPCKDWPNFLSTSHANATAHHFRKNDGSLATVVCLGSTKGRKLHEIYGLLVHEAVHIWQEYREFIGERFPSSEFEAYSIQWIAQNLIDSYIRQTLK